MSFEFNNNIPIYIQLVEQLKIHIISGSLKTGERLPSVRDLALQNKVNPNTMQKALVELEDLGLIYTERTNGKYVTEDKKIINNLKKECAQKIIDDYFLSMSKIGISKEDAICYLGKDGKNAS